MQDWQLLEAYGRGDQDAFGTLVNRHIHMVYATARRQVGESHADDVTQAVFILLAQKYQRLERAGSIAAWLYRVTLYVCTNHQRTQRRREHHERKAIPMEQTSSESSSFSWPHELLESAMMRLSAVDRQVVLLHFLEAQSYPETGRALGISEEAARKRGERSLDKLRKFFSRHGCVVPAAALTVFMAEQAATAASATTVAAASASAVSVTATTSAAILAKSAAKAMVWVKIKAAATVALVVVIVGGAITVPIVIGQAQVDRRIAGAPLAVTVPPAPAPLPAQPARSVEPPEVAASPGMVNTANYCVLVDPEVAAELAALGAPQMGDNQNFTVYRMAAVDFHAAIRRMRGSRLIVPASESVSTLTKMISYAWPPEIYVSERQAAEAKLPIYRLVGNWDSRSVWKSVADHPSQIQLNYHADLNASISYDEKNEETTPLKGTVSFNQKLTAGDMMVAIGAPVDMAGRKVIVLNVLEAFGISRAQSDLLDGLHDIERWRWVDYGPSFARWGAQRALQWEALAERRRKEGDPAAPAWERQVDVGTTVRLIAINRYEEGELCWWDGDGNPVAGIEPLYIPPRLVKGMCVQVEACYTPESWPAMKELPNYPNAYYNRRESTGGIYGNMFRATGGGNKPGLRWTQAFVMVDPSHPNIIVRVDTGEGHKIGEVERKSGRQTIGGRQMYVENHSFDTNANGRLVLTAGIDDPNEDEELFVTLILKDGTQVPVISSPRVYVSAENMKADPVGRSIHADSGSIKLSDIARIELWTRPVKTVQFGPLPISSNVHINLPLNDGKTIRPDVDLSHEDDSPVDIATIKPDPATPEGSLLMMRQAAQKHDLPGVRDAIYVADPQEEAAADAMARFLMSTELLQQDLQKRFPKADIKKLMDGGYDDFLVSRWAVRGEYAYKVRGAVRMILHDGRWKIDMRTQSRGGIFSDTYALADVFYLPRAEGNQRAREDLAAGKYSSPEEAAKAARTYGNDAIILTQVLMSK